MSQVKQTLPYKVRYLLNYHPVTLGSWELHVFSMLQRTSGAEKRLESSMLEGRRRGDIWLNLVSKAENATEVGRGNAQIAPVASSPSNSTVAL